MNNIFKELAEQFKTSFDYVYQFDCECDIKKNPKNKKGKKSKKPKIVNLSIHTDSIRFTHIIGADHINQIESRIKSNPPEYSARVSIYHDMLNGTYELSNLSKEFNNNLNKTFLSTFNINGKEYTIADRLSELKKINSYLDKAYTGKFYCWSKEGVEKIKLPNGKYRECKIPADYVLVIPTGNKSLVDKKSEEKMYIFLKEQTPNYPKSPHISKSKKLVVISAFADCVNLTDKQGKPYEIYEENKINIHTDKKEQLFYKPRESKDKSVNIQKTQINTTTNLVLTPDGAAAMQVPAIPMIQPPSFDKVSKEIKNILNKLKNAVDLFINPQNANNHKDTANAQKRKKSATNKQRTTNRLSSQGARKSTVKTASKSKEKPATKQPEQPKKPTFRISRSKMNENAKKVNQKNKSSEKGTRSKNKNNNIDL